MLTLWVQTDFIRWVWLLFFQVHIIILISLLSFAITIYTSCYLQLCWYKFLCVFTEEFMFSRYIGDGLIPELFIEELLCQVLCWVLENQENIIRSWSVFKGLTVFCFLSVSLLEILNFLCRCV